MTDLESRLAKAFRRHLGQTPEIRQLRALTGGAASSTWCLDIHGDNRQQALILRTSQGADGIAAGLDKATEARVQTAAYEAGIPVAEILFTLAPEDELGEGFVMERLEGESIPQKILRKPEFEPARGLMTRQCADILARIHRVDPAPLSDLPELSIVDQIELYDNVYRDSGAVLPVFELALRWLRQHNRFAPVSGLVHGDFRNGNFLVDPQSGINAVLDWELAHLGDPMEDLGWLCVNSWRFGNRDLPVGGFGHREELYAAYGAATGTEVDPEHVAFWELFGVLKWGVICLYMTGSHLSGEARSIERAAIGRRVSETEIDLLVLMGA
jgi:aminoglycoside phosphotransferase (APT) family kinase protein